MYLIGNVEKYLNSHNGTTGPTQGAVFFIANAISGVRELMHVIQREGFLHFRTYSRFRRKDKHILRVCFLAYTYIKRVRISDYINVGCIKTASVHCKKTHDAIQIIFSSNANVPFLNGGLSSR